jgi:hypothetical protein
MTKNEANRILDEVRDGNSCLPIRKITEALWATGDCARNLPVHTRPFGEMASTNGWKAHAWHRAKELEQHPLGIFKGISQELTKIMKEINDLHRD